MLTGVPPEAMVKRCVGEEVRYDKDGERTFGQRFMSDFISILILILALILITALPIEDQL